MEERLPQLLDKILKNHALIVETFFFEGEYYFRYKTHALSVLFAPNRGDKYGDYSFYMYPRSSGALSSIAQKSMFGDMSELEMISFNSADYPNTVVSKLEELYNLLRQKYSKVDDVFEDILRD